MPEGDTVWLAARRLDEALATGPLTRSDLRVPALATVDLAGRSVLQVTSRGKHLLMRINDGRTLHSHLRMEGSWHLYRPDERWHGGPAHQIRAIVATHERTAVGYRLGVLDLWPTAEEDAHLGHLGPDLLGADWNLDEAVARITRSAEVPIIEALLDQRNLAGIGNIYACETLFLHRRNPFTPVGEVANLEAIVTTAQELLLRNAPRASQATTGDERRPHYVHGRRRGPCYRCGTAVSARRAGAQLRWVYWCPVCQR